jgi:hypothetical protein
MDCAKHAPSNPRGVERPRISAPSSAVRQPSAHVGAADPRREHRSVMVKRTLRVSWPMLPARDRPQEQRQGSQRGERDSTAQRAMPIIDRQRHGLRRLVVRGLAFPCWAALPCLALPQLRRQRAHSRRQEHTDGQAHTAIQCSSLVHFLLCVCAVAAAAVCPFPFLWPARLFSSRSSRSRWAGRRGKRGARGGGN